MCGHFCSGLGSKKQTCHAEPFEGLYKFHDVWTYVVVMISSLVLLISRTGPWYLHKELHALVLIINHTTVSNPLKKM